MSLRVPLGFLAGCLPFLFCGRLLAQAPGLTSTRAHFEFRQPHAAGYNVEGAQPVRSSARVASRTPQQVKAWPDNGSTNYVVFNSRVVLQLEPGVALEQVLDGHGLQLSRQIAPALFILQAADVWTALNEAETLARDARVRACYPVTSRPKRLLGEYAPRPNDPFFFRTDQTAEYWQAHLENRDTNGTPQGVDLNVRAAWPISRGEGVLVAVADNGIELTHPDLADRVQGEPHYNFVLSDTNGMPAGTFSDHATEVAGLVSATANNRRGVAGVAPKARLASWVIWGPDDMTLASEEGLMDMFQYQSNVVSVQNHSWGKDSPDLLHLSILEDLAISNAVHLGRSGRGVVLVRAAGNGRVDGYDANEDAYLADPRGIGVAAVRLDGRVARYSSQGACILVAAPGGDSISGMSPCLDDSPGLVTTDRQGDLGSNSDLNSDGGGDYVFGSTGFVGTSGAAPLISGVAALILGVNTNLTYRDVQQILIHSSRQFDFTDPTLVTNAAGFRVSHNTGFGVPDAGMAVDLARSWPNRPQATNITYAITNELPVPDLGLRVLVRGTDVPDNLRSIAASPAWGPQIETESALLPLVDVGAATNTISTDLRGRAALIQRGGNYFCEKISLAAQAGAEFAIIYNNRDGDARIIVAATDSTTIPAAFISQNDGEALRDYLAAQPDARVQISLTSATCTFEVKDTLQCEFVGLRLDSDHSARGDLRIVLTSPSGTRSVLQHANQDTFPGPLDWTYYTVQDFYESSAGTWTLRVTDEDTKGSGSIKSASLILTGVPIRDEDHDGLDDGWEMEHFNTLAFGPMDDPDRDGYSNAREQVMGTDPNRVDAPFQLHLSVWDGRLARLSWPSDTNTTYRIQLGPESVAPLALSTNIPGRFRETEWFFPYTNALRQFFRLQAVPKGQ